MNQLSTWFALYLFLGNAVNGGCFFRENEAVDLFQTDGII